MSKTAYPLKLPVSVKAAAARLAKADGVSLNQFIAVAVAEKVGVLEMAQEFLDRRAGKAMPRDLLKFLKSRSRQSAITPTRWRTSSSICSSSSPQRLCVSNSLSDRRRSWTKSRPWETQRTLFSARGTPRTADHDW
jgi:hypothetical protein